MITREPYNRELPIHIDLNGPDGNVFALIGLAKSLKHMLGYSTEAMNAIIEDMMTDDYEHAIRVFDNEFGDFVILHR